MLVGQVHSIAFLQFVMFPAMWQRRLLERGKEVQKCTCRREE
jgi:hypothetical protein